MSMEYLQQSLTMASFYCLMSCIIFKNFLEYCRNQDNKVSTFLKILKNLNYLGFSGECHQLVLVQWIDLQAILSGSSYAWQWHCYVPGFSFKRLLFPITQIEFLNMSLYFMSEVEFEQLKNIRASYLVLSDQIRIALRTQFGNAAMLS